MPGTLDYTTTYTLMSCGECGISFAVPGKWYERKRLDDHRTDGRCPNGHGRVVYRHNPKPSGFAAR
jgi:hypothetical protein